MRVATLNCLSVLLLLCATSFADNYPMRTWVNDKGESLDARLKSFSGQNATLEVNGEFIRAPISRLSSADREWIKQVRSIQRWREWTLADGSTQRAKLESFEGTTLLMKTRTSATEEEWSLDKLSDADRALISEVYEDRGAASEETLGGDFTLQNIGVERTWTDMRGKTISAEFRGIDGNKILLFYKDREWRVPLAQFSESDRQWVADSQKPAANDPDPILIARNDSARNTSASISSSPRYDPPRTPTYTPPRLEQPDTAPIRDFQSSTIERSFSRSQFENDQRRQMDEMLKKHGPPTNNGQSSKSGASSIARSKRGKLNLPGTVIVLIAGAIQLISTIWFLAVAAQESVGWLMACMLIPFAALVFMIKFWDQSSQPFLLGCFGSILAIVGGVIGAM